MDYTTKYFDLSEIPNCTSHTVAEHTKAILSRYGIPKEIISDGGPEFIGKEYKQFCKAWDINHTYSSPEHHESNGLAERTIQTVKRTLKKALKQNDDLQLALLALRTSPTNLGLLQPNHPNHYPQHQQRGNSHHCFSCEATSNKARKISQAFGTGR